MKKFLFLIAFLFIAQLVSAQTHPCDVTPPTSGTGVAGQPMILGHCHVGTDTNNNPITGFAVYDNTVRTLVAISSWVKSATANAQGRFYYTYLTTVPATGGLHTFQTAAMSGTAESVKSNPFALTVSLPQTAPVAPTNLRVE